MKPHKHPVQSNLFIWIQKVLVAAHTTVCSLSSNWHGREQEYWQVKKQKRDFFFQQKYNARMEEEKVRSENWWSLVLVRLLKTTRRLSVPSVEIQIYSFTGFFILLLRNIRVWSIKTSGLYGFQNSEETVNCPKCYFSLP